MQIINYKNLGTLVLTAMLCLLSISNTEAQAISGPSSMNVGQERQFSISFNDPSISWSINNNSVAQIVANNNTSITVEGLSQGTFTLTVQLSSGSDSKTVTVNPEQLPNPQVSASFPACWSSGSITVLNFSPTEYEFSFNGEAYQANHFEKGLLAGNHTVKVRRKNTNVVSNTITVNLQQESSNPINPGALNNPHTICFNGNPEVIGSNQDASGGDSAIEYEWQYSNTGTGSWIDILNQTGETYNPPSGLQQNRWYRRGAVSCNDTKYTPPIKVTVIAQLSAPTGTTNYTVCGTGNVTLTMTPDSDADGVRWYSSSSGGTYLGGGNLSRGAGTYYASSHQGASGCESATRTAVTVSQGSSLNPGSIDDDTQELCYDTDPTNIANVSAASGGVGPLEYMWQYKTSQNGSPVDIPSATSSSYNPSFDLTSDAWYRRKVEDDCSEAYTDWAKMDVTPLLSAPTGTTSYTVCGTGNVTLTLTPDSDADGVRWYSSSSGGTYLGGGNLSRGAGTYYASSHHGASGCESATRTAVTVSQGSSLNPGSIDDDTQELCYNTDPTNIANVSEASGGVGPRDYMWQYKTSQNGSPVDIPSATGSSYNPSFDLTSDAWYRRKVEDDCSEAYTDWAKMDVTPQLSAPTGTTSYTVCGTGNVTLTLTPDSDADGVRWYSSSSGGTYLGTGNITRGAGTYYASSQHGASGCESATRTAVVVGSVDELVWYPDSDNDGFRDPNSAGENDCNDRGDYWTTTTIDDLCPNVYNENNDPPTVWFVDADNDGLRDSSSDQGDGDCDVRGAGWTTTETLDNCPDFNDPSNPQPQIWYADLENNGEGDGLGDPNNPSEPSCLQPSGYVSNSDDLCPDIASPTNECSSGPANFCLPGNGAPMQFTGNNYIYSRTYQTERSSATDFFTEDPGVVQGITYFDGLGRPIQQISIDQSPNQSGNFGDLITHMAYDGFGRMEKDFLPYATTAGNPGTFRSDALSATMGFYNDADDRHENTTNPFSQKAYESSPLNRVLRQAAPGDDWAMDNGHEIKFSYETNTTNEVRLFVVDLSGGKENPQLDQNGFYPEGELYKNITRDENHETADGNLHTTEEFTDKQGRIVLKRTFANVTQSGGAVSVAEPHDTYYVYDDYGNLTYVLPPKMDAGNATKTVGDLENEMPELGYKYVYDGRNRLIEKQIPGKGKESIIYNKLNQPIMTQDANLRAEGTWLFTKYDIFGRVAYTGKATDNQNRETIQGIVNGLTIPLWVAQQITDRNSEFNENLTIYYDNGAYPTGTLTEVLTIDYYDEYIDVPSGVPSTITLLDSPTNEPAMTHVNGLPTVGKVKVLDQNPAKWITTATYYDSKARPIYTFSENEYLATVDILETRLDFVGKPLKTKTTHTRSLSGAEATIVTIDNFTYDRTGRLLAQTQCIGDETLGDSCPQGAITDTSTELVLSGTINDTQVHHARIVATSATLDPGADLYIDPTSNGSGGQELIAYNTYDNLGQLERKKVGGKVAVANGTVAANGLQTVDYKYNVRGWLKQINNDSFDDNDLFDFTLSYNDPQVGAQALYNGNISQTLWSTKSVNIPNANGQFNDVSIGYNYSYDPLNRIIGAKDNTGRYNLGGYDGSGVLTQPVTYDKNGNIETLYRTGHTNANYTTFGAMDQLTYAYDNGNQLQSVGDGAAGTGFTDNNAGGLDYEYDANGNMTRDLNKGIGTTSTDGITYNYLNLPTEVVIDNAPDVGTISYIYDATGVKLRKNVLKNGVATPTDYAGNYVYENNSLQFFSTPEGYVEPEDESNFSQGFNYIYQYKDHLSNVRLSYTDANGDGTITVSSDPNATEIVEENNYYPFGLKHKGYNNNISSLGNSVAKKYMFGGKEYQDELDLGWYDITARNYDPALGRWMNLDPLAEVQEDLTPYHYGYNSPIIFSDPTGTIPVYGPINFATRVINEDDPTQTYTINDGYDFDFYVSDEDFQTIVNNSNGSMLPSSKLPASTVARWVSEATASEIERFKSESPFGDLFAWFGLDEAEAIITQGNKGNFTQLAIEIGTGKLKKLKKFARWLKKNKGKKLPGTAQGGGQFKNREGKLPKQDAKGKDITYQKYDVEPPTQDVRPRGTKRMVIGSDGKVYYTEDHYNTFTEIKPDGN